MHNAYRKNASFLIQRIKLGRKIAKSHNMWRAPTKAAGTNVINNNPLNNNKRKYANINDELMGHQDHIPDHLADNT